MKSYFFLSVLMGFPLLSTMVTAAEKCSSDQIVQKACDYFESHKDQKEFKTSDGDIVKNPRYQTPVTGAAPVQVATYGYGGYGASSFDMASWVDVEVETEIDIEAIINDSKMKEWPPRTRKIFSKPMAMTGLLAALYPQETKYNQYGSYSKLVGPVPPEDPKAKIQEYSAEDIRKVRAQLGEDGVKKIKARMDAYLESEQSKQAKVTGEAQSVYAEVPREKLPTSKTSKERQQRLFDYAKSKMIEMVKRGRDLKDLTEAEKNHIKRIETVRLKHTDNLPAESVLICANENENAVYSPERHSVYMCPSTLRLSDASLVSTIGHEIGHSIDPCNSGCDLYHVNAQNAEDFLTSERRSPNEDDSYEDIIKSQLLFTTVARMSDEGENGYMTLSREAYPKEMVEKMKDHEIIKPVARAVPRDQYPGQLIKDCLVKDESFDEVSEEDVKYGVKMLKDYWNRIDHKVSPEQLKTYEKSMLENKECSGSPLKLSEMREVMSDMGGAYVLSSYLKENPPKSKIDAYASLGLFLEDSCLPSYALPKMSMEETLKLQHPMSRKRIERIFFKFPGVAQHFDGCDFQSSSKCFKSFEYLNQGGVSKSGGDSKRSDK